MSSPQASLALNGQGRVAPATVRRVQEAAERLGYRPNPLARALRTGQGGAIGLLTRNLSNSYFLDVLRGLEEVSAARGSHIVVMDSGYNAERELAAVQRMAEVQVGALALAPVGGTAAIDWWREHHPERPLVLINVAPTPEVSTVGPHNGEAVRLAVEHFTQRGHDRIGFICAPGPEVADDDRTEAFLAQTSARGVAGEVMRMRLHFDVVGDVVARELADPHGLRAFLMNSDYTASAVYRAAHDGGLTIGRDVSVIGHDDIPTSALLAPPMTTISFDRREVGRAAAECLLDGTQSLVHVQVPVALAARASVADLRP